MKRTGKNTLNIKTRSTGGVMRVVLVAGVGIISIALLIKLIAKGKKVASSSRAAEDPNVQMAMLLNSAINPNRTIVGGWFTGANVEEIMRLAHEIKNFGDVSKEYNNLYGEALSLELQDALGDQYPVFQRIISGGTMSDQEANSLVIAMFNEIDGVNWSGRNITSFRTLVSLSNIDFKKVVTMYNTKYNTNFIEDLKDESAFSVLGVTSLSTPYTPQEWNELVDKIADKHNAVFG